MEADTHEAEGASPPRAAAVLGLGAMGAAAAGTLARCGFAVTVWNRSPARAERLVAECGVRRASSPAEAVADCDVAITMLADREAVEAVYTGPGGVLLGAHPGLVMCEMSTVEPDVSQCLAPQLRARGADLLDTPVSGSVPLVEQGSLTIMVGGARHSLVRARPVLDALSARIFELGDVGSGAAMKLAVNAVVHALDVGIAEALVLAEAAGVDRGLAYDVFESSAAGAPFVRYKRQAFEHPEAAAVAFRLVLMEKDLDLITSMAERLGVAMAQARANLAVTRAAAESFGDRDMAAIATFLRQDRTQ